jgi:predicted nucleic acid-binding protein
MSPGSAAKEIDRIKGLFRTLPDVPDIYPVWESLVRQYAISGKPAHDARLVAAMLVHGLTSIVTFDKSGFSRFPFIGVVYPGEPASEA